MTADEAVEIERLGRLRTVETRFAERVKIIRLASQGCGTSEIAGQVGRTRPRVLAWIKRFNEHGTSGLGDLARSGRPATYGVEDRSTVIATALMSPETLGLPFASWTLDRLAAYPNEVKGIAMKRSRIDEILIQEGLRWRKHETWFGERVDPEFAKKRGSLNSSTLNRHRRGS